MNFVRNKSAYLAGVMGRFRKYGGNARLHPDIQTRLDHLFKINMLRPGQLDARCVDALQTLPTHIAVRAIDRFSSRDLRDIRNVSAFFMSNVKAASQESNEEEYEYSQPQQQPPPPPRPRVAQQSGYEPAAHTAQYVPTAQLVQTGVAPAGGVPMASSQPVQVPKKNYGVDQAKLGVRTDEFHSLSVFAVYVRPAPALKLQELWDDGNALVSLLDDAAWSALSDIGAPEALTVIEEAAALLTTSAQPSSISGVLVVSLRSALPHCWPKVLGPLCACVFHLAARPQGIYTCIRRGEK
jgi:hypothetical protein